ncbi:hypothetical protein AB0K43_20110 [Kitasatospora sp. NPDC049258]|uniref:hypothetical protein n=1 Tax=Kitasatospora sp. NPDC049258 TaxID=3155394 RepID=UPI003429B90C
MPAAIAPQPVTIGAIQDNISIFGEKDPGEPQRAAVQLSLCLRFHDLVGLLAFHPVAGLTGEMLADDHEVSDALRFTLADSNLAQIEDYAGLAVTALSGPGRPFHRYTAMVGEAVTRVFGLTAPITEATHTEGIPVGLATLTS